MKTGAGDTLNILNEDRDKWLVWCDGELMSWCLEATAGDPGYVVHYVMGVNGFLYNGDGTLMKKKRFGKVEFTENPDFHAEKTISLPR